MHPLPVTVYTPSSSLASPGEMLLEMRRDLLASRELGWRLAVRDISAQYRQTALGLLWAFVVPLAHTLTWIFLYSSGVVRLNTTDLPYPVYVLTGTLLWAILMDALNAPLQQTQAARPMLAKLNFPREALILSGIYQTLFNAGIKLVLLLGALWLLGITPDWHLLLFPLALTALILTGTALGLLLTPLGLLYADIGRGLPLAMQFLMYLTPVVFPMPAGGWAATLFTLNPLTPLILSARAWLTGLPAEHLGGFATVFLMSLALLLVVWVVYRLAMPILIERMNA